MIKQTSQKHQLSVIAILALCTLLTKLLLAIRLDLYSDEIFYWQASQFPALAYSDLPFMTALLAGAGAELFGHHSLAVRSIFILLGSSLPALIYWIALPIFGARNAVFSAMFTFCLPMAAFLGQLAVPDVPLIFFGLLFLGYFERATRTGRAGYWYMAGIFAALGLCTHYRFILYPVAAFLFLLMPGPQRAYWQRPVTYAAGTIALCGLYPALSFNLGNDLSGLDYHLLDRHPWRFQLEGLLHPFIQAAIVTPLMYATFIYTLYYLFQRARHAQSQCLLLLVFSASHLAVFMILAPWSDTTRTTLHWPLSGYFPLLVALPAALIQLQKELTTRYPDRPVKHMLGLIPVSGLLGTVMVFFGIGSQGFNATLQQWVGTNVLSNKMAGWIELNEHVHALLEEHAFAQDLLIITDNYYTSAQLAFGLRAQNVYTIDENKTIRDGRAVQYALWQRDRRALQDKSTISALFITEDSTLNVLEYEVVMRSICDLLQPVTLIDQLWLYQGDKRFSFYYGTSASPQNPSAHASCPLPPRSWVDTPQVGEELSGTVHVSGWAFAPEYGVSSVRVLLNRQPVAETVPSIDRPDVVRLQAADVDPGAPRLGFQTRFDTRHISDGRHELALEIITGNGRRDLQQIRSVHIRNN